MIDGDYVEGIIWESSLDIFGEVEIDGSSKLCYKTGSCPLNCALKQTRLSSL